MVLEVLVEDQEGTTGLASGDGFLVSSLEVVQSIMWQETQGACLYLSLEAVRFRPWVPHPNDLIQLSCFTETLRSNIMTECSFSPLNAVN